MLKQLYIQNYALIEEATFTPGSGLTVITGETGSGKSILLGALGLVLGERSDLDALRRPDAKCVVEATLIVPDHWQAFFETEELDFDRETILRRELSPAGKSRAFINDTPVNLKLLKRFGRSMVDIHSQMETSRLTDRSYRFALLDAAAGLEEEVHIWQKTHRAWLDLKSELKRLIEAESKSKLDLDYFRFQLEELEALELEHIDPKALEEEAELHRNAESIAEANSRVNYALEEDERSVIPALKELVQSLDKVANVHQPSAQLRDRLKSVAIELQDIAAEAADAADSVEQDPATLTRVEAQLDKLYALQSKHRLNEASELSELRDSLREKISSIDSIDDRIAALEKEVQLQEEELRTQAATLHAARINAATRLSTEISDALSKLKMPDAALRFAVEQRDNLDAHGCSDLSLLFTANKGSQELALEKAASGGERSRVMLALKSVLSYHEQLPTLILDEIDTGVSGEVAARMAEMMQEMGQHMQLIAISHLPQVAGKADCHYRVSKEVRGDSTFTRLHLLDENERVEELAAMLSGKAVTESAREHAKALMTH